MITRIVLPTRGLQTVLGISILLVFVSRLPLMPEHLFSFDSVNLALALEEFDPAAHRPQPPGYPLFVAEARLLYWLLGTPERTFTTLKILISALAVAALYSLGKRMLSAWVGLTAAALLFVNPVFWHSGLASPLRLHLALISILVAYFCWRAYCGEPRYFYAASIALGLGGGFRPALLLVLFPLWAWTAWQNRQPRYFMCGALLLGASTLAWVAALAIASGGFVRMVTTFRNYLAAQTYQTSVLLGAPLGSWRRMVGRALVWNGLGVLSWVWTLPFGWSQRNQLPKRCLIFLTVWFLPAFLFNTLIHIGSPGHALATIPALCIVGAFCLVAAEQTLTQRFLPELREKGIVIWIALVANTALFFVQFPLSYQQQPETRFRLRSSIANAIRAGLYETSYGHVVSTEYLTKNALRQIHLLQGSTARPVLVVWGRNGSPVWRKVSYYFPSGKVYALEEKGDPAVLETTARLWSDNKVLAEYSGRAPLRLPVPGGARLIWLMGPRGIEQLKTVVPVEEAGPLYYTDLPPDSAGFGWRSFEFVPNESWLAGK